VSEMAPEKLKLIRDKLRKKFSVGFLVTGNFEIHIGTTAAHKDIYTHLPVETTILDKGVICGSSRSIDWSVSDSQKPNRSDVRSEDLAAFHNAVAKKINDCLDLEFYLQSGKTRSSI